MYNLTNTLLKFLAIVLYLQCFLAINYSYSQALWGGSLSSKIYNENDGEVGIGLTNPASTLHLFDDKFYFTPSGSATSCVLKLSNVESGMRGRDGFDIQLGEYDVILRNNEAGKVKLINKYQKGLTINLDNSIETNSNKF